jgi:hypothetical protein
VVWYTGQFYALFFLTQTLKVDGKRQHPDRGALLIGTPFFLFFGSLSDKIGRKPIILAGCLIAALTYFPLFKALTHYANPHSNSRRRRRRSRCSPIRPPARSSSTRWGRRSSRARATSRRARSRKPA